ncbi:hypothetical protein COBT_000688 [Conglomerata obtusa]
MSSTDIIQYFKNLDLHKLDALTISTINAEIAPAFNKIILHNELSYKLESLIEQSTADENYKLIKRMSTEIVKSKIGSRVFEKLIIHLNAEGFIKLCEDVQANFHIFFENENATFILRKIFSILKRTVMVEDKIIVKNNEKRQKYHNDRDEKLINQIKLEKMMVKDLQNHTGKIEQLYTEFFDNQCNSVIKSLPILLQRDSCLFTLQQYLQGLSKKQKIIKKIIECFLIVDLKTVKSHFYQNIFANSKKRNINRFYEKIKNDVMELAMDKHANYVIQELCKYTCVKEIEKNINSFAINSNIIFNMSIYLLETDSNKAIDIIQKIYLKNEKDVFSLLLKEESIDSKFLQLVEKLFYLKEEHNLNVNSLFRKYFKRGWLYNKNGRTLIRAFLGGSGQKESKIDFVVSCKKEWKDLNSEKWGLELLKNMLEFVNNENKIEMEKIYNKGYNKINTYKQKNVKKGKY